MPLDSGGPLGVWAMRRDDVEGAASADAASADFASADGGSVVGSISGASLGGNGAAVPPGCACPNDCDCIRTRNQDDTIQDTHGSADNLCGSNTPSSSAESNTPADFDLGANFKVLSGNDQIKEIQTIIRDRNTTRSDFKFYADRLIRLIIEESLNQLPYSPMTVTTPTGCEYHGLRYERGNCGVSIVRSGEAMEQGLRDCCRSIRIGKILVESDADTHEARVVYARFPDDVCNRKVLLMYPIMSTGNTVIKAVSVLREHDVLEDNIILANLFCTPQAAATVTQVFPQMKILTSEVHPITPNHFGQKYFGTD